MPSPTATYTKGRETKDDRFVLGPISLPVRMGVAYRFELYTHCSVDHSLDFDGSFWDAIGRTEGDDSARQGFGDPYDKGTMTLISKNRAKYIGSSGETVLFKRHHGPFFTFGCA